MDTAACDQVDLLPSWASGYTARRGVERMSTPLIDMLTILDIKSGLDERRS